MKILTSKNVLNINIAQMNSKFYKIIPCQKFKFLYFTFYMKSCKKKYSFEGFKWFLCFYMHLTIDSTMKIAQFIRKHCKIDKKYLNKP